MHLLTNTFRLVLFLAASCLVLNDVVRLVFPFPQQTTFLASTEQNQEEENAPIPIPNFLEEEVKHHEPHHWFESLFFTDDDAKLATGHLIQDDDISVLAFITIFSPPPNRA